MKKLLSNFWQQRQPRERTLLICGAAILIPTALFFGRQSAQAYQQHAEQKQQRLQRELVAMQQQESVVTELLAKQRQQKDPDWQQPALSLAKSLNLPLRVAESESDSERLVFQPIVTEFSTLLRWLILLETEWHIKASQLELKSDAQGVALVRLELRSHE